MIQVCASQQLRHSRHLDFSAPSSVPASARVTNLRTVCFRQDLISARSVSRGSGGPNPSTRYAYAKPLDMPFLPRGTGHVALNVECGQSPNRRSALTWAFSRSAPSSAPALSSSLILARSRTSRRVLRFNLRTNDRRRLLVGSSSKNVSSNTAISSSMAISNCRGNAQNPVDRGHVADSSLNIACQVTRHFVLGVGVAA
jgi:hypothetical protein